jgi:DNA-binding transcriptional MerR regulator
MRRRADSDAAEATSVGRHMRMAELSAKSGVPRETIHFYLREGLLPRPRKGGRTVAYYDEQHLERLAFIRRLREEKYLPIAVIRRLIDAPGAAERDVETLAEVLDLLPAPAPDAPIPSEDSRKAAIERGLLGPMVSANAARDDDASEQRVLSIVEQTLALSPGARELTLADLTACATSLSGLVLEEASLFFDTVLASGDVKGSIGALRGGRAIVARFIAAYRDLMLRRIVDELLASMELGPQAVARARTVPLSPDKELELGVVARREAFQRALDAAPPEARSRAARALVVELVGSGAAAELAALPLTVAREAGEGFEALVAWGGFEAARSPETLARFERAAESTPRLALVEILVAEANMARGVREGGARSGVLDETVPALARLVAVDPARDDDPTLTALAMFLQGRMQVALPPVLGRAARGKALLERALTSLDERVGPPTRARITGNAHLSLGRHALALNRFDEARAHFDAAIAVDPVAFGAVVPTDIA